MQKILIIDGNNLLCIAKGAANGKQKVQLSFINMALLMIGRLLERYHSVDYAVIFDGGRDLERVKLYPEYKKKARHIKEKLLFESEEEKTEAFETFKAVLSVLGAVTMRYKDVEADDLIYTLVKDYTLANASTNIIVVSTDKDMYQLLDMGNIAIYNPVKGEEASKETLFEQRNLSPRQYLYYACMVGDDSDNISGVGRVGKKRAMDLIKSTEIWCQENKNKNFFSELIQRLYIKNGIESLKLFKRNLALIQLKHIFYYDDQYISRVFLDNYTQIQKIYPELHIDIFNIYQRMVNRYVPKDSVV